MKDILSEIKSNAAAKNATVVLPEGEDSRVVLAAVQAVKEGLATVTLLGNKDEIKKNKNT